MGNLVSTIRLTQKYVVVSGLLCGLGSVVVELSRHYAFSQGPNSDNISLCIASHEDSDR